MASLAARLLALHELHARGLLTDEEFALAKARVIAEGGPPAAPAGQQPPPSPPPPPPAPPQKLNPVVPGVGLALGAAAIANGGLGG
jgi:hypothetical protein